MKRLVIILGLMTTSVLLLFLILRLAWSFEEKKVLNIYILDKTVTHVSRPEHKAFTWLLNKNRYVLPNKLSYSHTKDYYGFFPVDIAEEIFDFKSVRINEVDAYASAFDMAYYTDCYGVHSFEWYKGKTKPIRSQKVYGGLNQNDFLLMKKLIDSNKLVLAEYNMLNAPTNALVRTKTEALLGISWTGWTGKYFSTFDVQSNQGPPEWIKNLFESQHIGVWPSDKDGIILINNDGLIELLIAGEHLAFPIPSIVTKPDNSKRFGLPEKVLFEQWFEFVGSGKNNVVSEFILDISPKGKQVLSKLGLNEVFPAVIQDPESNRYYYFCGDFADNPVQMWTAKLAGGKLLNHMLFVFTAKNQAIFFNNYYTPLIEAILDEHYQKICRVK